MVDMTGDGMTGAIHYTRGHVTFKRSLWSKVVTAVGLTGFVLITLLVVGNVFNVNVAQTALETLIAGN
jgi:hypothetical protein